MRKPFTVSLFGQKLRSEHGVMKVRHPLLVIKAAQVVENPHAQFMVLLSAFALFCDTHHVGG